MVLIILEQELYIYIFFWNNTNLNFYYNILTSYSYNKNNIVGTIVIKDVTNIGRNVCAPRTHLPLQ